MAWFGVTDRRDSSIDIESIAERHGLRPHRMGDRLRFFCPFCYVESRRDRTASAALREELQPWKCWRASCDATGNARTLAAHFGELDLETHRRFEARPKPKPKPKPVEKTTVQKGWQELLSASTDDAVNRIYHWARDIRGWPDEIARTVSYMDDIVCPLPSDDHGGRSGRVLARQADATALRLMVAIRCHQGIVRSAMRMWLGPEAPPEGKVTKMALSQKITGESDTWGSAMIYGSIPRAVEAVECGEPVYIVEGAPDYLAAAGLIARVDGAGGAVLGSFNAHSVKRLVERLLDELNQRSLIAPRVVFIPDMDRVRVNPATGEAQQPGLDAFTEAAATLRGRAGVCLLKLPRESETAKMDLAQKLREVGPVATLALMKTATMLYPPPIHLDRCQEEMSARFRRAVMEATQKAADGKKTLVIYQVEMGAGKTRNALDEAAKIITGELKIPVSGRRPRGWPKERWPPPDRSVVFAASNHGEADERMEELDQVSPGACASHIYGLLYYCQFAQNVEHAFPHVGRRGVCGDPKKGDECPHYQTCPGSEEPRVIRGEITFVAHKLVAKTKADLVIIDESPGVITTEAVAGDEITTLFASKAIPRVVKWRRHLNPVAGDAAKRLAGIMTPLAHQHATKVTTGAIEPYGRRITGEELAAMLDREPALVAMLRAGFGKGATRPPVPFPDEIRTGQDAQKHMPSMSAFNALAHLIDYYLRIKGKDAADDDDDVLVGADSKLIVRTPRPLVGIHLDANGGWGVEIRKVQPLPDCPVVILDATGSQTLAEWRAAYPERRVVLRTLDVQGTAPATAIHMESPGFSRRGLVGADGEIRIDAVTKVADVIEALADRTRAGKPRLPGAPPTRLGVLTHKPIADALRGGVTSEQGQRAAEIVTALAGRGFAFENEHGDPTIGWFGRHDRGTNAYRHVDGLIVIGDPVGNFGDIEQDAILLGLDAGEISMARTAATCRQAIARARHIRRDGDDRAILVFAGKREPFLPGVRWERQVLQEAVAVHEKAKRLHEMVLFVAYTNSALSTEIVRAFSTAETAWDGLGMEAMSAAAIGRQVKRVAMMRRWPRHTFQIPVPAGAPVETHIWSENEATARFWFRSFYPQAAAPAA